MCYNRKIKFNAFVTISDLDGIHFSNYARFFSFMLIRNLMGCSKAEIPFNSRKSFVVKFITSKGVTYPRTDAAKLTMFICNLNT